jgi:soluble lytic murein transglycosylase-like protein
VLESADAHVLSQWAARYEHGVTVPRNIDRAIELYCRAARRGDSGAQYNLGAIYALGRAGQKNAVLGASWLWLAAEQGEPKAEALLAELGVHHAPVQRKADCVSSENLTAEVLPKRPSTRVSGRGAKRHPSRSKIERLVLRLAPQYGLDPEMVLAVIEVESNFDPKALSPKNAQGLMQLIPHTATRFGVKDVWDPEQNLRGGMAYLRWLLKHFHGDLRLALAAYNAGEQTVQEYGDIPPFPETREYVRRITRSLAPEQSI